MTNDRIKDRLVHVVEDATSTDVSLDLRVRLKITGSLPFVSAVQKLSGVDDELIDSSEIIYDKSVKTSRLGIPDDAEFKNALFDVEMEDRFVHFAFVGSTATRFNAYLIYDKKFKDILMVPNLRTLGDGMLKGRLVDVECWLVGASTEERKVSHLFSKDSVKFNLPEPLASAYCSVHAMLVADESAHINNNYGYDLDVGYGESNRLGLRDYAGLGGSAALFGEKIPVYQMVETSLRGVEYVYCGMQEINDVLIPLPF